MLMLRITTFRKIKKMTKKTPRKLSNKQEIVIKQAKINVKNLEVLSRHFTKN